MLENSTVGKSSLFLIQNICNYVIRHARLWRCIFFGSSFPQLSIAPPQGVALVAPVALIAPKRCSAITKREKFKSRYRAGFGHFYRDSRSLADSSRSGKPVVEHFEIWPTTNPFSSSL